MSWTSAPAAVQVSAIKQGIAELRAGLRKAEAEISVAADLVGTTDEGAALMAQFANMMAAFHTSAVAAVARTEVWLPVLAWQTLQKFEKS